MVQLSLCVVRLNLSVPSAVIECVVQFESHSRQRSSYLCSQPCAHSGTHPRTHSGTHSGTFRRYLALTGARLKGEDVVKAGVATHYVASDKLDDLMASLATVQNKNDYGAVAAIMDEHDSSTSAFHAGRSTKALRRFTWGSRISFSFNAEVCSILMVVYCIPKVRMLRCRLQSTFQRSTSASPQTLSLPSLQRWKQKEPSGQQST